MVSIVLAATLLAALELGPGGSSDPARQGAVPDRQPTRPEARAGRERRPAQRPQTARSISGPDCSNISVGLTPLTELRPAIYMGAEGGLYPGAKNSPPRAHAGAGRDIVRRIRPLTPSGEYDGDGRYVLLSIGVSNTEAEFSAFEEVAASEPSKDDDLVVVNGSQGGVAAAQWADPSNEAWSTIDDRLAAAGVTPRQVAIAWVKVANRIDPQVPPEPWPAYAQDLQRDMESIARILADRYPNIRVAYYSSRVYGGYADDGPGNPEPFAYESGFSVKWMIERQILGAPGLNYDPARGSVEAPWLAWGPYLWADGLRRRADGLAWRCSDFQSDGTHPSLSGQEKVAALLLEFLTTDPSAVEWFTSAGGRHRRAS